MKKELEKIKNWELRDYVVDAIELIKYIKTIWQGPREVRINKSKNRKKEVIWKIELHTLQLKDNERIIRVLEKTWFWKFYWEKSRRGGHYYFLIPREHHFYYVKDPKIF